MIKLVYMDNNNKSADIDNDYNKIRTAVMKILKKFLIFSSDNKNNNSLWFLWNHISATKLFHLNDTLTRTHNFINIYQ